jgi:GAF domain-containing protein/ANTAR domain-containing protein
VVTESQPPASERPSSRDRLTESLIILAGTPDDDSTVNRQLTVLVQLCADRLDPVAFASVTREDEGKYSTVAVSSELALAVDEAQYADDKGPCLDALAADTPVDVPQIDATMLWPGFRDAAHQLGLRSSLSIPLFAGRGLTVAALNLYGREPAAMAPLSAAVLAAYDETPEDQPPGTTDGLCPGAQDLVAGLSGAFAVRATIQQALGMIIADRQTTADLAYALLRSRAAETSGSLVDAATAMLAAGR